VKSPTQKAVLGPSTDVAAIAPDAAIMENLQNYSYALIKAQNSLIKNARHNVYKSEKFQN